MSNYHGILGSEFARELEAYGRIYMYRFRPDYPIYARNIDAYPHRSETDPEEIKQQLDDMLLWCLAVTIMMLVVPTVHTMPNIADDALLDRLFQ